MLVADGLRDRDLDFNPTRYVGSGHDHDAGHAGEFDDHATLIYCLCRGVEPARHCWPHR
jgi:hypothetical protein